VKKALIAATTAVGLMLASPGAAQAAYTHCDWDPIVPVITPGGNLVLVYDSVWTAYATSLGLPLASYTAKRAYDSSGRPVTAVDMAINLYGHTLLGATAVHRRHAHPSFDLVRGRW